MLQVVGGAVRHGGLSYRADIDGLRAVAVSSVVIYHAFPKALPGGFVGVDIFFVISGFLITSILLADAAEDRFSILRFYDRRVRRIFPALIAVLLATIAIGWLVLFPIELQRLGKHVLGSGLFVENFVLLGESGYFDRESHTKPLLHLWSLAIEEQFYLVWPILIFLIHRSRIDAFGLLVAGVLLSLALNVYQVMNAPAAAYYSPFGRFWELMIGAVLAWLAVHRPGFAGSRSFVLSSAGAVLIAAALVFVHAKRDFPGLWALLPTLGAACLIAAGPDGWVNRHILSLRPMVWIGLVSYPLYLWHWPILAYVQIVFQKTNLTSGVVAVGLALGLAVATYRFVERPFRGRSDGAAKPLALAAGMAAVTGLGAALWAGSIPARHSHIELSPRTEWDFLHASIGRRFNSEGQALYRFHDDRARLVVFVGDSQIAQYAERVVGLIDRDPARGGAVFAIGGACIPIEGVTNADPLRRGCWPLRQQGFDLARADRRVDRVVIGGSWNWYLLDSDFEIAMPDGTRSRVSSPEGRAQALDRLEQQIRGLTDAGKQVFLLIGNPISKAFDPASPAIRLLQASSFPPDLMVEVEAAQHELAVRLRALALRSGAVPIDAFRTLCEGTRCRATTATGTPIFKDSSHFNPDWALGGVTWIDVVLDR